VAKRDSSGKRELGSVAALDTDSRVRLRPETERFKSFRTRVESGVGGGGGTQPTCMERLEQERCDIFISYHAYIAFAERRHSWIDAGLFLRVSSLKSHVAFMTVMCFA
jgi:hypothetical protein